MAWYDKLYYIGQLLVVLWFLWRVATCWRRP